MNEMLKEREKDQLKILNDKKLMFSSLFLGF